MGKITTTLLALAMLYAGAKACDNKMPEPVQQTANYYVKSVGKIASTTYERVNDYIRER